MGLSVWQILIIVVIIIILFGAKRLPELGRSLGEALNNFKKGLKESDSDEPLDPSNQKENSE